MEAAVLTAYGTPVYADFPDPAPSAGQSVVTVLAASINALDIGVAEGAPGVRLVEGGSKADPDITLDAQLIRQKGATVRGFGFYQAGPENIRAGYRQLAEWAQSGQLRVQAEEVPLAEVADARGREARARHELVLKP